MSTSTVSDTSLHALQRMSVAMSIDIAGSARVHPRRVTAAPAAMAATEPAAVTRGNVLAFCLGEASGQDGVKPVYVKTDAIAASPDVIFTSYGDMLRVPGSSTDLLALKARGADVVICDTAGRLQAQATLMDQLAKVLRVMKKSVARGPDEVLLVLDGTSGQNAMSQARIFKAVVGVTGVALTKLDGTAKGGVVVAIKEELGLDVKLVGLGEGVDDLRDFDPAAFVEALVG